MSHIYLQPEHYQMPPEDGWCPCDLCNGRKRVSISDRDGTWTEICPTCEGYGGWDADGIPCEDPSKRRQYDEACAAAERYYERNER